MKCYSIHRPILLLFLTLSLGDSYDHDKCWQKRCQNNGPDISFPFRLKEHQPKDCGLPGFDLSCTERGETALELPFPIKASLNGTKLPFPVKFLIEYIDYESRLIIVSQVDGCLLELLPILNLSASPFRVEDVGDFSIFNCSSNRTSENMPIACLSKPGHLVYAVSSSSQLYGVTELISCIKMFAISAPYALIYNRRFLYMEWTGPRCRLKDISTAQNADCFRSRGNRV